jgi:hypothetical protein
LSVFGTFTDFFSENLEKILVCEKTFGCMLTMQKNMATQSAFDVSAHLISFFPVCLQNFEGAQKSEDINSCLRVQRNMMMSASCAEIYFALYDFRLDAELLKQKEPADFKKFMTCLFAEIDRHKKPTDFFGFQSFSAFFAQQDKIVEFIAQLNL